jgi:3-methyladenine DNA glycosylase AlkD
LRIINSKTEIRLILGELSTSYHSWVSPAAVEAIHDSVLKKKIRFPILEDFTIGIYPLIPKKEQPLFLQKVIDLDEIGSYVIAGKFLQLQLDSAAKTAVVFNLAEKFIIQGDQWYVCDIIGERVFGHALLHFPDLTLKYLKKLSHHKNEWMVRCIGVAAHYAIKKGLAAHHAEELFLLLLQLSGTTSFHTKKGIGWAAKTTAKFHPQIIKMYEAEIYEDEKVRQWFKTKIKIGLSRSFKYATKYNR